MKKFVIYILSILLTIVVSIIGFCTYRLWLSTKGINTEIKEGMVFIKDEE